MLYEIGNKFRIKKPHIKKVYKTVCLTYHKEVDYYEKTYLKEVNTEWELIEIPKGTPDNIPEEDLEETMFYFSNKNYEVVGMFLNEVVKINRRSKGKLKQVNIFYFIKNDINYE